VPSLDHIGADGTRMAVICHMPDWSGLFLELRRSRKQAPKDRGWNPVTLSVQNRQDLVRWMEWLDRWGTMHSPLLTGVRGWVLVFEVRYLYFVCAERLERLSIAGSGWSHDQTVHKAEPWRC